ncbi:VOC family protein [Nonomuraea maheshkhaliensis]|uniref:VOC family protein n=1 Tax=Nonomuraea maheshkhaliensis TaxID=419590 RepID=A0ABP4U4L0_9ACTN
MHRTRVYALLLDTPAPEAEAAVAFWAAALGATARPLPDAEQFISLHGALPEVAPHVAVQSMDDGAPRMHVDIETDDVEAETRRLIELGASEVGRWQECRTLRTPGGHVMCVLPVESDAALFDAEAKTWP